MLTVNAATNAVNAMNRLPDRYFSQMGASGLYEALAVEVFITTGKRDADSGGEQTTVHRGGGA